MMTDSVKAGYSDNVFLRPEGSWTFVNLSGLMTMLRLHAETCVALEDLESLVVGLNMRQAGISAR